MFHVIEEYRVVLGPMRSSVNYGNNGAFIIPKGRTEFTIIASDCKRADGRGLPKWEHVSIHCTNGDKNRTPTWSEMCFIKNLFWDEEDVVVQFHPKKTEYVNHHPYVLHLWRYRDGEFPTPPMIMI